MKTSRESAAPTRPEMPGKSGAESLSAGTCLNKQRIADTAHVV